MTITLTFTAEKKHSVRYDTKEPDVAITTVYIRKAELPKPYPRKVKLTVEFD